MFRVCELHKYSTNSKYFLDRATRVQSSHNFYNVSDEKYLTSPNLEEINNKPKINKRDRKPKRSNMMNRLRDNNNSFNYSFRNFNDNNKKRHQKEHTNIEHKMADYDRLIRMGEDLLNDKF